jgi:predicted  nucleic acid-binding Zn-ribbon protein
MSEQPEALWLADELQAISKNPWAKHWERCLEAAAKLRRLHAENEMLWKEREEPHQKVAMYVRECNRLEDERDELRKVNAELLEALKAITAAPDLRTYGLAMQNARAAIARAEGEPK